MASRYQDGAPVRLRVGSLSTLVMTCLDEWLSRAFGREQNPAYRNALPLFFLPDSGEFDVSGFNDFEGMGQ